jgi:hypothetical protein
MASASVGARHDGLVTAQALIQPFIATRTVGLPAPAR